MTNEEAVKILEVAKAEVEWSAPLEYQEAFDIAIDTLETVDKTAKQLEILADVLDGCPLTNPCDKLWKPMGWCEKHCKDGQAEPSKECWLKYAEVMTKQNYVNYEVDNK